ncbi:DUF1266 domain-containing protein [Priestia koreensis]|uniref:DUF1266 domain-containing protein n=1 Tax=Priestia koreensis TaxID=284581 RepID=UPI001F5A46D9|nr:DUF1266 domain-containing protein [Priestia koreensis]MCM3005955.1 DUF1266 domain-containing protein [Priestia koreensis]UNL85297.1 DUF1266 domain-containing protein [Priestia koreensis]
MHKQQRRFISALASTRFYGHGAYYSMVRYTTSRRSNGLSKRISKKNLESINVIDNESAHQMLSWMLETGARTEFYRIQNLLLLLSKEEQDAHINSLADEPLIVKFRVAQAYLHRLPDGRDANIGAFDYAGCVLFAGMAHQVGYLSKQEAAYYERLAAQKSQEHYQNWQEYITSVTAGVHFSQLNEEHLQRLISYQEHYLVRSLVSKTSPLRKVDWNTEIS